MRLFIAIPLPTKVQKALSNFSGSLKEVKGAKGTFPKSTNMHITLQFLGEVSEEATTQLIQDLENELAELKNLPDIHIEQVGAFPNLKAPKVIWVGGIASEELIQLVNKIYSQTKKIGIVQDQKVFIPHITIMRIKQIDDSAKWIAGLMKLKWTPQNVPIKEIVLYQSQLTEKGPIYTNIHTFRL